VFVAVLVVGAAQAASTTTWWPFAGQNLFTGSPIVYNGVAYVGISAKEESLAFAPDYVCCTFRGAVVALDVSTGQILWKSYLVPSNNGGGDINAPDFYSGNGVWGSSPVVDVQRGLLYVGTANNFSAPPGVCRSPEETGCEESGPDNHFDSIVALRLGDGAIAWARRTLRADVFSARASVAPISTSARRRTYSTSPTPIRASPGRCSGSARRAASTGRSIRTTAAWSGAARWVRAGSAAASSSGPPPTTSVCTWPRPTPTGCRSR
jgi:hypothetical protein